MPGRMQRKNKGGRGNTRQTISFPSAESVSPLPGMETPESIRNDAEQKREAKKAADAIPDIFKAEDVTWIFDVYVVAVAFACSVVLKTDFGALHNELKMDDAEKLELGKPLARICSKYAPSEWAGMQAEIHLVTFMGLWTITAFRRCAMIAERLKEEKKAQQPQPVRGPVPAQQRQAVPV